jgi:hypothetical protein
MFGFIIPDAWTVINAVAGSISALAAFATVWIAVWAFRQARKDKESDDEARRPDFSLYGSITMIEGDELSTLDLGFQNRGTNPAQDISCNLVLLGPPYDGTNNHNLAKDIVGAVHTISSFGVDDKVRIRYEGAQHYLIVKL